MFGKLSLLPKRTSSAISRASMPWSSNTKPITRVTPGQMWERGQPFHQPYYTYSTDDSRWVEILPDYVSPASGDPVNMFSILSWNIDFMLPLTRSRMQAALGFLENHVKKSEIPCIIMLQEMLGTDLELIQQASWVQSGYHLTDVSDMYWESSLYGTCTLISKSLPVSSIFRVHYEQTDMERDGLFVDIVAQNDRVLRTCNTHLESLAGAPPLRPSQLQTSAGIMHQPKVYASVLGGDLNAIQAFDKTLHSNNDLNDAYLIHGGREDDEKGCTWGQMARTSLRDKFGLSRMDKLLYRGELELIDFHTFGYDVQVDAEQDRQQLIGEGLEKGWVTDHLGVHGVFRLSEKNP